MTRPAQQPTSEQQELVELNRRIGEAAGSGSDAACFHNLRVFIRDGHAAPWRLLAWLNEPHPTR